MRVRVATPDDGAAIARIYTPFVLHTAVTFELEPPDGVELGRRIRSTLERHPYLVAVDDGGVIGFAYAGPHRARPAYRWSAEVSVYVSERARGRGVARALYERLFLLLRHRGIVNVYAGIALPNDASIALHDSFGFEALGVYEHVGFKHGRWHDTRWAALTLELRAWHVYVETLIPLVRNGHVDGEGNFGSGEERPIDHPFVRVRHQG